MRQNRTRRSRRACVRIQRHLVARLLGITLRFFERHFVEGVRVILSEPEVDRTMALNSLRSALQLLERVDPIASGQFKRVVKQINVWPGETTAYDRLGGIHLAAPYLLGQSTEAVAATLIHEFTHLRIASWGIPYHPALRERIERLCVTKQAGFLMRIGSEHAELLATEVLSELHAPWWTVAERRARVRANLEKVDLPGWLDRFFRFR